MLGILFGSPVRKFLTSASIIAIVLGGAYFYYTNTQNRIDELIKNAALLEAQHQIIVQENKNLSDAIDSIQQTNIEQQKAAANLYAKLAAEEQRASQLRTMLSEHDLTYLAMQKPGLIERLINDATKKVFSDIHNDTSN